MFHKQLRRAIALAFPDRYTDANWRSLLADYTDREIIEFLKQRDAYEAQREVDPTVVYPPISSDLK